MKVFSNVAVLVAKKRNAVGYSQTEVTSMLGYKNGQFISNVERALCGIPDKCVRKLCEELNIDLDEYLKALLADRKETLMSIVGEEPLEFRKHKCDGPAETPDFSL